MCNSLIEAVSGGDDNEEEGEVTPSVLGKSPEPDQADQDEGGQPPDNAGNQEESHTQPHTKEKYASFLDDD